MRSYSRIFQELVIIGSYIWFVAAIWRIPKDVNEFVNLLCMEDRVRRNMEMISLGVFWLITAVLFVFVVLPTVRMFVD